MIVTASLRFHVWKKGMDGYFYIDQLGWMKFRLFRQVPEV